MAGAVADALHSGHLLHRKALGLPGFLCIGCWSPPSHSRAGLTPDLPASGLILPRGRDPLARCRQ